MGGKAPSPPPPPDPYKVSAADQHAQTGTAIANTWMQNANEYGPFGNVSYNRTGTQYTQDAQGKQIEIPTFSRTQSMSPAEQAKYDAENALTMKAYGLGNKQFDALAQLWDQPFTGSDKTEFSFDAPNAPDLQTAKDWNQDDYEGYRARALDTYKQYMQPQLDKGYQARMTELQNQGITRGSDAYDTARQQADRTMTDANLQMVMQAGSEADRARMIDEGNRSDYMNTINYNNSVAQQGFGNAMDITNFKNSLAAQQYQKEADIRSRPIQEMSAILGLGGDVNVPQFAPYRAGTIQNTDVAGNVYKTAQLEQQNYQAKLQAYQAKQSGLFGLGSAAIGGLFRMSDRRLKTDIEHLSADPRGFSWYRFRYITGGPSQVGVMADEVARVIPAAVLTLPDGFQAVNYGAL